MRRSQSTFGEALVTLVALLAFIAPISLGRLTFANFFWSYAMFLALIAVFYFILLLIRMLFSWMTSCCCRGKKDDCCGECCGDCK